MSPFEWWTLNVSPIITQPETAGTVGSILSLKWAPGKTWKTRFFAIGSGLGLVAYAGPAIAEFYNITSQRYLIMLGFFLGFGGPYILAAAADLLRELKHRSVLFARELQWRDAIKLLLNIKDGGRQKGGPNDE